MPLNKADKKRIRQQLIQGQVQIARIDQSNLAEVVWDLIDDYTKDGEGKRQALIQQILLQMPEIALAQFSRGSGTPTNLLSLSCNASDAHIRKFIPSLLNAASEFKEKSEQQEVELCKSIYTIIALAYTGDDQKSIAREVCNVVSTSPNLATLKAVKAKDGSQVSLAQCLLSGSERQKVYYGTFFRASTAGKSDEEISAAIADAMRRYYGKGATDIDSEVWGYILELLEEKPHLASLSVVPVSYTNGTKAKVSLLECVALSGNLHMAKKFSSLFKAVADQWISATADDEKARLLEIMYKSFSAIVRYKEFDDELVDCIKYIKDRNSSLFDQLVDAKDHSTHWPLLALLMQHGKYEVAAEFIRLGANYEIRPWPTSTERLDEVSPKMIATKTAVISKDDNGRGEVLALQRVHREITKRSRGELSEKEYEAQLQLDLARFRLGLYGYTTGEGGKTSSNAKDVLTILQGAMEKHGGDTALKKIVAKAKSHFAGDKKDGPLIVKTPKKGWFRKQQHYAVRKLPLEDHAAFLSYECDKDGNPLVDKAGNMRLTIIDANLPYEAHQKDGAFSGKAVTITIPRASFVHFTDHEKKFNYGNFTKVIGGIIKDGNNVVEAVPIPTQYNKPTCAFRSTVALLAYLDGLCYGRPTERSPQGFPTGAGYEDVRDLQHKLVLREFDNIVNITINSKDEALRRDVRDLAGQVMDNIKTYREIYNHPEGSKEEAFFQELEAKVRLFESTVVKADEAEMSRPAPVEVAVAAPPAERQSTQRMSVEVPSKQPTVKAAHSTTATREQHAFPARSSGEAPTVSQEDQPSLTVADRLRSKKGFAYEIRSSDSEPGVHVKRVLQGSREIESYTVKESMAAVDEWKAPTRSR